MAVENSKRLDATAKEHIRRIKSTYKMKYTAMAVINAKLGCGMEEAYRLYDQRIYLFKNSAPKEN